MGPVTGWPNSQEHRMWRAISVLAQLHAETYEDDNNIAVCQHCTALAGTPILAPCPTMTVVAETGRPNT